MKVVHSFSALRQFETCPKQYFHQRIAKDVKDEGSEHTRYGTAVHKAFEDRLRDGTPLPPELQFHEQVLARIEQSPGEGFAEQKIAVDRDLQPTGFFSEPAWLRGVVDYAKIAPNGTALVIDWKTGKFKPDFEQVELCAAMLHRMHPDVEQFSVAYYWTKERRLSQARIASPDLSDVWRNYLPRLIAVERAIEEDKFPCRPSGLCKRWCPVKQCKYNGI